MKVINPYASQYHDALRQYDSDRSAENRANLDKAENDFKAYTEAVLTKLGNKREVMDERITDIKRDYPSLRQQYKQACILYRAINNTLLEVRAVKKTLREAIGK